MVGPTLGLGEHILESWQKTRLEIQQRRSVGQCSLSAGFERHLRVQALVPREGRGLAGGCAALELFGFPTLGEAGIYHTGPGTNQPLSQHWWRGTRAPAASPCPGDASLSLGRV